MFLLSILAYLLFFTLLFLVLKGDREQQLLALLLVNILFYINIGLIEKPELTPYQLLPYLFFAKEVFFNFHQFRKQITSFPIKFGLGFILLAYFATTWSNGGNLHDYYEAFRYCFDKYVPIIAVFICAKKVEEKSLVRHLFLFFLIFCGLGFVEYLLNYNYVREAIATAFPSTRVPDMFGPAGITNGFGSSGWRTRISITTKHPTVLGAVLSTMFLFSLSYLKVSKNQYNIRKRNFVLFFIAFTAILSGSRTAMGCIGLGFLIYFTISLSFKKKLLAIIIYAIAFYGLSSAATTVFSQKEGGSSLEMRQQQLLFTVIEFANKPLFGHGLYYTNHTILASDDEGKRVNFEKEETQGLESIVFYALLDIGLFGILALSIFYGQIFLYFFKHRKECHRQAMQGMLETSMLVLFLILSGEIGRNTEICLLFIGTSLGLLQKELSTKAEINVSQKSGDSESE